MGHTKKRWTEPSKGNIKSMNPHVASHASDVSISFHRSGPPRTHDFAFCNLRGFCFMLALLIACSSSQRMWHNLESPLNDQPHFQSCTHHLRGWLQGSQPYHTWPELLGLPLRSERKLPVILPPLYSVYKANIVPRSAAGWDVSLGFGRPNSWKSLFRWFYACRVPWRLLRDVLGEFKPLYHWPIMEEVLPIPQMSWRYLSHAHFTSFLLYSTHVTFACNFKLWSNSTVFKPFCSSHNALHSHYKCS